MAIDTAVDGQGAVRFESRAMGSPLRLTVAGGRDAAERAWAAVLAEFAICEEELSRFRPSSALTRANLAAGDGVRLPVPPRLGQMAVLARRAQRLTHGRFDARVIEELEELGERGGTELRYAADRRGEWLEADPRRSLLGLTTPIDSGGVGKGLALRRSHRVLGRRDALARGGLLEAGGDLVVWGVPAPGATWRIGLEDVGGGPLPMAVVEIRDGALATSSNRLRRWTAPDGTWVHHLIDPRTRRPADTGLASVTVATSDPVWAEVWSKALFLAGVEAIGPESVRRRLATWWTDEAGRLRMNERADTMTVWAR